MNCILSVNLPVGLIVSREENLHGMRLSIVPIEEGEIAIRIFAGGKFTGLICGRLYAEPDVEALFIVNSSNNMTEVSPKSVVCQR